MNDYIDQLIQHCEEAKNTENRFRETFTRDDYNSGKHELYDPKATKAIYVIKSPGSDLIKTSCYLKDKKKKTTRAYPRINKPIETDVMYVGSSSTDLKKRLKEHLKSGHEKTSSLHMETWEEEYRRNIVVEVRYYEEDLSRNVLQIIEDGLSYELKPIFGKPGSNGK